jgi:hypothetical protein
MATVEQITETFSVRNAFIELSDIKETSSWDIIKKLLEHHGEYGNQKGKQVAAGPGPSQPLIKPTTLWLGEVSEMFDPEMVSHLRGRLLILGLCRIDRQLKKYLEGKGFYQPLADELWEDFESLLLPEYAGDQAYRREFMKLLQNKPVDGQKPRDKGFVALVNGGPGLQALAELCHRQTWNTPFTARYVISSGGTFGTALNELLVDLGSLSQGNQTTRGYLLPDPVTDLRSWRNELVYPLESLVGTSIERWLDSILDPKTKSLSVEILQQAGQVLGTGRRLVLLIEFRQVPASTSPEQLGLPTQIVSLLNNLPERVGVVLSGLPDPIVQTLNDDVAGSKILNLPPDRELTRGESLANDMPVGPDRLNILGEVNALAEAIALKDMQPPMVVGVMGGWGAGKSFVLHLIENRIQEIRCERVNTTDDGSDSNFPFVGHPYLIRFDAWTYAKGNLWASLMQQVFFELDRQVGLEQTLAKELKISLTDDTEIWRVISKMTNEEQDRLLMTEIGQKALQIVNQFDRGQIAESQLWSVFERLKQGEIDGLRAAEIELDQKRLARDRARLELQQSIDYQIEQDARRSTWAAVTDEFLRVAYEAWLVQTTEPEQASSEGEAGTGSGSQTGTQPEQPTFTQVEETIHWYKKLIKERSSVLIAFVLFALAATIVAFIASMGWIKGATFTTAVGVLGSVWTGLRRFQHWMTDAAQRFEDTKAANRRLDESMRDELMEGALGLARAEGEQSGVEAVEGVVPIPADVAEKARVLARFDSSFEEQQMEVEIRRQRVGMAARHANLIDFVRQRLEGRVYEDKLGLLHQVKSDLEDLTSALLNDEAADGLFPRGKPRIILLIDDLDRCPPDKVVEVLEAAQLLVKTPLFVVVIAMDVRYVTRALEKVYQDVLIRRGEPSGLDYIEKILQIPYRVRPVAASEVGSFLWSQMSPEVPDEESTDTKSQQPSPIEGTSETARQEDFDRGEASRIPVARSNQTELRVLPTRTLRFSVDDHKLISECCASFEVNPRTMKRLVNVFKLLKIIWYRQGLDEGPEDDVKRAMLALLVIAARFPEPMRQLLHDMERMYVDPVFSHNERVVRFLMECCLEYHEQALVPQEWAGVQAALSNPALISQELTFEALHDRHLHLVSTFSFIGECDPERSATLQRDLAVPLFVAEMKEQLTAQQEISDVESTQQADVE